MTDFAVNLSMVAMAGTLFALAAYVTFWLGETGLGFVLMLLMLLLAWAWAEMTI